MRHGDMTQVGFVREGRQQPRGRDATDDRAVYGDVLDAGIVPYGGDQFVQDQQMQRTLAAKQREFFERCIVRQVGCDLDRGLLGEVLAAERKVGEGWDVLLELDDHFLQSLRPHDRSGREPSRLDVVVVLLIGAVVAVVVGHDGACH